MLIYPDSVKANIFKQKNSSAEVHKTLKDNELTLSWQVKEKLQEGEIFQILQSTDDDNFSPVRV